MIAILVKNKDLSIKIIIFLLIFSFFLSELHIYIGFALKPFMIFITLLSVIFFAKLKFFKPNLFEQFLYIFYFYLISTGVFAKYPLYSLRLILGIVFLFYTYTLIKVLLSKVKLKDIEASLSIIGVVISLISLVWYLIGVIGVNFNFHNNGFRIYGLLLDRGLPRLIGIFNDPNIFVYFNSIFFFYYLTNLKSKRNKIGLGLTTITLVLTFSRGALLGVVIAVLVYFILFVKFKNKIKITFLTPIFLILINFMTNKFLKIDIFGIFIDRIEALSYDNGSGRYILWEHGIDFFLNNPLFGIGIFNFRPYELEMHGIDGYLHNTYLDVLVEGGLIGLVLFILMYIILMINLYKLSKVNSNSRYLLLTAITWLIIMNGLSLILAEIFFLFIAIVWRYNLEARRNIKNEAKLVN